MQHRRATYQTYVFVGLYADDAGGVFMLGPLAAEASPMFRWNGLLTSFVQFNEQTPPALAVVNPIQTTLKPSLFPLPHPLFVQGGK